jgi:CheY-like chemotaxis protein
MESAKLARTTMPMIESTQGSESVLLVEDDEAVRALACTVLSRHGYQVVEASDGQEALDLVQGRIEPVNLLITDVIMPHLNGLDLYRQLRQQWPDLRVLFMSGYTEGEIDADVIAGGAGFLQKPFTPEIFSQKVRELLDRT